MDAPRTSWRAVYFDGESAQRHEVSLRLTPGGLHLSRADGSDLVWPFAEIVQTQGRERGEVVRLERGLEALVVEDSGFLEALSRQRHATGIRGSLSLGRRWAIALFSALGLMGFGTGMYLWGLPAFARQTAHWVPPDWEERLGKTAIEQLAPASSHCQDPAANAALRAIVARLADGEPSPHRYRVILVNEPAVNALAAPGGTMLVYRGLVARAETPEELAGVLAHEMAHVRLRHPMQALFRDLSTKVILAALAGDAGGLAQALDAIGGLGALRYSRDAEREADREGMRRLRETAVDPRGMVRFFSELQRMEPTLPGFGALSTHPPTRERLAEAKRLAADWEASGALSRPILTPEQWQALRHACPP